MWKSMRFGASKSFFFFSHMQQKYNSKVTNQMQWARGESSVKLNNKKPCFRKFSCPTEFRKLCKYVVNFKVKGQV